MAEFTGVGVGSCASRPTLQRRKRKLGKALGDGFQLQEGREDDMYIWLSTGGFVNVSDRRSAEDEDGNGLCDGSFAVAWYDIRLVRNVE